MTVVPRASSTALSHVAALLRATRFRYATEDDLQAAVTARIAGAGLAPVREVRLSPADRIDILVGDVGIEVKTAGGVDALRKQLARYAASPRVGSLLVVTTRHVHTTVPPTVGGKPVDVVVVRSAW